MKKQNNSFPLVAIPVETLQQNYAFRSKYRMDLLEKHHLYAAFWKQHREIITQELKTAYAKFSDHRVHHLAANTDFSSYVGIPLFLIGLACAYTARDIDKLFIIVVMICFGFWIKHYQRHVIKATCRDFFIEEMFIILDNYIDNCRDLALRDCPEEQREEICQLYEYYRKELHSENIQYY